MGEGGGMGDGLGCSMQEVGFKVGDKGNGGGEWHGEGGERGSG